MNNGICCVVVTYNRIDKLKKTLLAYEKQSRLPDELVVVDNYSTDGTRMFLEEWENISIGTMQKKVIYLDRNVGGSGGFYAGFTYALSTTASWIWVADDDAYPQEDAINLLGSYINNVSDDIVAICGSVWENGEIAVDHRGRLKPGLFKLQGKAISKEEYAEKSGFAIDTFSYVGTTIRSSILHKAGLPNKDYFIHFDDTEHSVRVGKCGKILCYPDIKIVHDSLKSKGLNKALGWRYYYSTRNRYDMLKKHYPSVYAYEYCKDALDGYMHIMMGRKTDIYRLKLDALHDASKGQLGIHPIYKPGWELKHDW